MIFSSWQFLFGFLPLVLTGAFLLARLSAAAAQYWLIVASIMFYAAWYWVWLPLLLGSILFNYLIAMCMARTGHARRRAWLWGLAAIVDLGLLGFFKYTGLFLENVNAVTGTRYTWYTLVLPLGISFYTFQQLTLLADIDSGHIRTVRFRDFLLFIVFFPHLIAGPIVHHSEMMPQFQKADYRLNRENLAIGLVLLCMGLVKKVILADGIADHVTPIFAAAAEGQPISFLPAWAAAVGFTLQMYFDFSGYSDMALGLGRMVGITLPMNFNSPLKALNVVAYWARWHMTLTRFLTAYVFNPLALAAARRRVAAGKKGLAGPGTGWRAFLGIVAVPTMTTMFLSGLWHGAGYQFLIFGLIHGAALVVNRAWRLARPRFWPETAHYQPAARLAAWALTFVVTAVALTWFHAASVAAGGNIVWGMFGLEGRGTDLDGLTVTYIWIAVLLAIALVPPNTLEILRPWRPAITTPGMADSDCLQPWHRLTGKLNFTPTPGWAFATAMAGVSGVLGLGQVSEFLYWQF